ncbi:MAG: hypothetical protein OEO21_11980, partial [Candidatus Krumholzibacteria bacterium]|nr:hypothetical protein [Candidatus Krumholzibacteria bacterium]
RELHHDASLSAVTANHGATVALVALVFGGLFLYGASRALRASLRSRELAAYLIVPLACTLILGWQNAKAFNARYVLVSLPAWLCVLAIALDGMGRRARVAAWAAVAALTAVSLAHFYFDGRYAKEDVRGAVRTIEARAGPEDCILAPTVWHVVGRYYRGEAVTRSVFQRDWLPKPRVDAQLEPLFAECNTVWYIRARPWVDDADGYVLRRLAERYVSREVIEFNGVELMLLEASDPR